MRRRELVAATAGALAASALAAGIGWAAIPGDGGVIQACYTKLGGIVRVIDTAKGEKCVSALEVPFSWNQKGQKGDPGTNGTNGTNGADGDDGVSPSVAQLAAGDPNCPAGGAAITDANGSTAYVCSGAKGADGEDGEDGEPFSGTFTSPNGLYSISVTDTGVTLASSSGATITIEDDDVVIDAGGEYAVGAGTNLSLTSAADVTVAAGQDATTTTGRDAVSSVGRNLVVAAASDLDLEAGGDASYVSSDDTTVESSGGTTFQSAGPATFQSSATFALRGSQVTVNGGSSCPRAARVGDPVAAGVIANGSTTVCIG